MAHDHPAGPPRPPADWDPAQYLRHADDRLRPFRDLLARVPPLPGEPRPRVTDLGCGPGHWTAYLGGLGVEVSGVAGERGRERGHGRHVV